MTSLALPMGVTAAEGRAAMQQLLDARVASSREEITRTVNLLQKAISEGKWKFVGDYILVLDGLRAHLQSETDNADAYRRAADPIRIQLDGAA